MEIVELINDSVNNNGASHGKEEFCREVESKFTPYVGQEFSGIEEAVTFYKVYALACGFDVRRYTTKRWRDGEIKSKLLVCNREGYSLNGAGRASNEGLVGETSRRRNRVTRVGCGARIRLFMMNGLLLIDRFHDGHNHELVSVKDREFQKLSRNISDYHKMVIVLNSRLRIGATKTYNICKEHVSGFENIGATLNDFKNFHRDVKCFIHQRDGQLFIDHFKEMAESRPGFYFDYDVDNDGSLCRAIWADSTCRKNYSLFGDGLSYDPTYSTNKYSMVFTPFTGVDHHKRSVTFCGALLAKEDYESFNWVFSRFLHAMGGKEPEYIITDQDPAIIKSVAHVFKKARHRFCMWHIMNKVPTKFGVNRSDYSEFILKITHIIWDEDIEAAEFDTIWEKIMQEHGLVNNDWFADTYAIRGQWVMAHCRDLKMASVMRTTQRSESENSFFKKFEDKSGTLVEFWMRYESAMDHQRHTQRRLDSADMHSGPKISTHVAIEAHGAKLYTYSAFYSFQEEAISSIDTCRTGGWAQRGADVEVTTVIDSSREKNFDVAFTRATGKANCTCTMFERTGILCRHIIWIFSQNGMKTIPDDYIAKRWLKACFRPPLVNSDGDWRNDVDIIDSKQIAMSTMWSEVHQTVGMLQSKDVSNVDSFSALVRGFKENLSQTVEQLNKNQQIELLINCRTASEEVTILPPKNCRNKGSGKRMLSSKAKELALASKPKRMCKNCKRMCNHDKRNCPNPFAQHPPLSEEEDEEEEEEEEEEELESCEE